MPFFDIWTISKFSAHDPEEWRWLYHAQTIATGFRRAIDHRYDGRANDNIRIRNPFEPIQHIGLPDAALTLRSIDGSLRAIRNPPPSAVDNIETSRLRNDALN
jgi:hypothetical protein